MRSDLVVCYVGDLNFLLGSLISLRSLRRFTPSSEAEIYLFYLDPDPQILDRVQRAIAPFDATILPLRIEDQLDLPSKAWNKTHVPRSALGRFFVEPHLPAHVRRLLYIDGDTFFVGDPRELFRYQPPEGALAAAEDISYFARNDWGAYGAKTRAYFSTLGVDAAKGYFNSGVLYCQRDSWKAIAADALRYFAESSEKCLYHDQSALNAVVGDRRVRLSPCWNFQTPFCYWGVRPEIAPLILHFTEFPKPWMGDIEPWIFLADEIWQATVEFAKLDLPDQRLPLADVTKYNQLKRGRAHRLARRMPVRRWLRRREIYRLAKEAAI